MESITIRERLDAYTKEKYGIDPEILCVKPKEGCVANEKAFFDFKRFK